MSSDFNDINLIDSPSWDKVELPCPCCEKETIVIDLSVEAEYECAFCGFAFETELSLEPFSPTLLDIAPLTTTH